ANAELPRPGRAGPDGRRRPGAEHRRPEPDAGDVDPRRAGRQPHAGSFRLSGYLRPLAPALGRELGAAGIFVRNEVLVAGQEEEGIHLPLHRLVGNVVAALAGAPELPVDDRLALAQRPAQREVLRDPAGGDAHLRSFTATGSTSL